MSHVELKEGPCHVTNIFTMSIGFILHVEFKKCPCHPVGFKGQGPETWHSGTAPNVVGLWA